MNWRRRAAELQADVTHAEHERRLIPRWQRELAEARKHIDHSVPVPRDGLDYSWARPDPWALRRAGVTFVIRYVSHVAGKGTTKGELQALGDAGIDVGLVYEREAGRMLDGLEAGKVDASFAHRLARDVGIPDGRPIYFACDQEVSSPGQLEACDNYTIGATDELGHLGVGVYGGYELIEHLHAHNACNYLWQTIAWSAGRWSSHAQLRQIAIERAVANSLVDIDRAIAPDFGQWRA